MRADLRDAYEFRPVRANEAADAVRIEAASFPVSEACTLPIMETRVQAAPDLFYVAIDRATSEMVGFTTSIATDEEHLRDEFFTDSAGNHDPKGEVVMVLSLAVLPAHRNRGIASALMETMLTSQRTGARKAAVLTCIPANVPLYEKMGYRDLGMSDSAWGGEAWHEMIFPLR